MVLESVAQKLPLAKEKELTAAVAVVTLLLLQAVRYATEAELATTAVLSSQTPRRGQVVKRYYANLSFSPKSRRVCSMSGSAPRSTRMGQ